MTIWICDGCGLEHDDSAAPPVSGCVFGSDAVSDEERGDLGPHGRWTTHAELARQPHTTQHRDHGRGVHSFRRDPRWAIGHWSFVVRTDHGNLLWDPPAYIDPVVVGMIRALGEVTAIATSHPHMFAAQVSWSHEFGRVPVWVNARGKEWIARHDPVIEYWTGTESPVPGVTLVEVGGHMPDSSVALTPDGTLLVGDTIAGTRVPDWVSFQRNVPGRCRCPRRWYVGSSPTSMPVNTTACTPCRAIRSTTTRRRSSTAPPSVIFVGSTANSTT